MNNNPYLKAFIAGSAFPVIVIPYVYIGLPLQYTPTAEINYFADVMIIPLLIGLLNVIFVHVRHILQIPNRMKYWLFGGINGLAFSLIGTLLTNIPTDLFRLPEHLRFATIPIAICLYACMWRYIIRNINIMMDNEK